MQYDTALATLTKTLSPDAAERILRKRGVAHPITFTSLHTREVIAREIAPALADRRDAEENVFQIKQHRPEAEPAVSMKVVAPVLVIDEAWLAKIAREERETHKAFTAAAKKLGFKRKEIEAALESYESATGDFVDTEDPKDVAKLPAVAAFIRAQRATIPA